MTTLAPDARGVLHRPAALPAQRQPEHDRLHTETRSGCCSRFAAAEDRHAAGTARARPTSTRRRSARSSSTSRPDRGNSARTRNIRLAAVRSFFQYCALRHPEHAALIQRVLAIPTKRSERRIVTFLTPEEVKTPLESPDRTTWAGRRDTRCCSARRADRSARSPSCWRLTCADVQFGTGPHLRAYGQGRESARCPAYPPNRRCPTRLDARDPRSAHRPAVSLPKPAGRSPAMLSSVVLPSTSPSRNARARRCARSGSRCT